jgi:hypothetical protein
MINKEDLQNKSHIKIGDKLRWKNNILAFA